MALVAHRSEFPKSSEGSSSKSETLNPAFKEWSQIYSYIEYNPDSFSTWEDLIEITEHLESGLCKASSDSALRLFRFSYDSFLDRFPLAYGYWIRYAKLEFQLGNTERALSIYDKAVSVMPLCVELWASYCEFKIFVTPSIREVRNLFERGASSVGFHYLSHPFWDENIKFETQKGDPKRLFKVYRQIVQRPIHQYAKYFSKLFELAPSMPVEELISKNYLEQFRAEYEMEQLEEQEQKEKEKEKEQEKETDQEKKNEKDQTTEDLKIKKYQEQKVSDEEKKKIEEADLRSRIHNYYTRLYVSIQSKVVARWPYESEIQRQYFHIVYLPEEEIINWRQYLNFIEINGGNVDEREQIALYERVIIPFGHYEEFWLRYTRWLISKNKVDEARNVYRRAGYILPIGRIQVRLQYALFEETQSNTELAKDIYKSILDALPSSTEVLVGYASLLHRTEGAESGISFLKSKLEEFNPNISTDRIANGGLSLAVSNPDADLPALTITLAQMYSDWLGLIGKARNVFESSADLFPDSYFFWREYLRFEIDASEVIFPEDNEISQNHEVKPDENGTEKENKTTPQVEPAPKKRGRGRAPKATAAAKKGHHGLEEEENPNSHTTSNGTLSNGSNKNGVVISGSNSPAWNYERVHAVYNKIKLIATPKLKENEVKDLNHIYMVYLLSHGTDSQEATSQYFKVDREIHNH